MTRSVARDIFKPARTSAENRNSTTTRLAMQIVENEAAARNAKTERLKKARLAMEAGAPPVEETKTRVKPGRKRK